MEEALSLKSRSKPQLRRALLPLRRMLWDVLPMGSRRRPTARATIWQVETAHCPGVTSKWMKSNPDS